MEQAEETPAEIWATVAVCSCDFDTLPAKLNGANLVPLDVRARARTKLEGANSINYVRIR